MALYKGLAAEFLCRGQVIHTCYHWQAIHNEVGMVKVKRCKWP
jgi:hypothetical protein